MESADLALDRFRQGYSCAQSVFSVLAERRGVETDVAFRIAAGLGGGICRSAQTCGCVTGAILAVGLGQQDVSVEGNRAAREVTYAAGRRFLSEFAARHGSTLCRELMGCDIGTPEGMEQARREDLFRRCCAQFVRDAVELVAPRP
ncbi:MAG: C-GCAxxG-C-C family protein [Acidobacteriia bacterium]|nr:C-GCAxxG-C-C family protein [Terriglobia bacterium]